MPGLFWVGVAQDYYLGRYLVSWESVRGDVYKEEFERYFDRFYPDGDVPNLAQLTQNGMSLELVYLHSSYKPRLEVVKQLRRQSP